MLSTKLLKAPVVLGTITTCVAHFGNARQLLSGLWREAATVWQARCPRAQHLQWLDRCAVRSSAWPLGLQNLLDKRGVVTGVSPHGHHKVCCGAAQAGQLLAEH